MKVLVLNCGSSSLKCQLIDMQTKERIMKGHYERIGGNRSTLRFNVHGNKREIEHPARDFEEAIDYILKLLIKDETQPIKSYDEIGAVGHRIVHGGEKFKNSVIIDDDVIDAIRDNIILAPLHNPAGIAGIEACRKLLPNTPMVAVFDTAFHQTIPEKAYIYQLPYKYYEDYKIRKYGFHGISHRYIAGRISEIVGKKDIKVINCHLGQGASLCAIENGESKDTTMGLTPLDGLMMGTRSGSIDPSILQYVMKESGKDIDEVTNELNKNSGFEGVCGKSDCRDVESLALEGDENAKLAIDMYCDRIAKYIADYYVELEGNVDAIVMTAGVLENGAYMRKEIIKRLACLGLTVNDEENDKIASFKEVSEGTISGDDSKVRIMVIPTNEEIMIVKDTYELIK